MHWLIIWIETDPKMHIKNSMRKSSALLLKGQTRSELNSKTKRIKPPMLRCIFDKTKRIISFLNERDYRDIGIIFLLSVHYRWR